MPTPPEHAFKEKSTKLLILPSLRTIYNRTFQCETPCIRLGFFVQIFVFWDAVFDCTCWQCTGILKGMLKVLYPCQISQGDKNWYSARHNHWAVVSKVFLKWPTMIPCCGLPNSVHISKLPNCFSHPNTHSSEHIFIKSNYYEDIVN